MGGRRASTAWDRRHGDRHRPQQPERLVKQQKYVILGLASLPSSQHPSSQLPMCLPYALAPASFGCWWLTCSSQGVPLHHSAEQKLLSQSPCRLCGATPHSTGCLCTQDQGAGTSAPGMLYPNLFSGGIELPGRESSLLGKRRGNWKHILNLGYQKHPATGLNSGCQKHPATGLNSGCQKHPGTGCLQFPCDQWILK